MMGSDEKPQDELFCAVNLEDVVPLNDVTDLKSVTFLMARKVRQGMTFRSR